jgi:hypothetical protein
MRSEVTALVLPRHVTVETPAAGALPALAARCMLSGAAASSSSLAWMTLALGLSGTVRASSALSPGSFSLYLHASFSNVWGLPDGSITTSHAWRLGCTPSVHRTGRRRLKHFYHTIMLMLDVHMHAWAGLINIICMMLGLGSSVSYAQCLG